MKPTPARDATAHRPSPPALCLSAIPLSETRAPEPAAPPLRALFHKDPAEKRAARLYWVHHPLQGLTNTASAMVLRHLPINAVSGFGHWTADAARWRYRKRIFAARIAANMTALHAYASAQEPARGSSAIAPPQTPAAALKHWWRNTGRTMAEFCLINRILANGRVSLHGQENLDQARASGKPLVFVSVHLSNWEVLVGALPQVAGRPVFGPFQPEPNRYSNRLIHRERKARNQYLFPPGQKAAFRLRRLFQGGQGDLILFIDDVRGNQVHFPLFGREAPASGNAVAAIKLANSGGGLLVPVAISRTSPGRFALQVLPPIAPAASQRYESATALQALNATFEPLVLEELNNWYMLAELRY